MFAYRAVEDIRSHFDPSLDDAGRKKGWNLMNAALGRKEEDYRELVSLAEKYRHGNMLGEPIDQKLAEKQIKFVSSMITDFIKTLNKP